MKVKFDQQVKNTLDRVKDFESDDAGVYSFTEKGWLSDMFLPGHQCNGKLRVALGDAGLKIKGEGGVKKRLKQYDNSKHLPEDRIDIGLWTDPVGFKRDYDIQSDLDKIATRIYSNMKAKELWYFEIPDQLKMNYVTSQLNSKPICDYVKKKIDEIIGKKNTSNIINQVKLRKLQKTIIKKIMKILETKGIESTLVAELAPRIGKTLLFLSLFHMMNRIYGHKVMMIFGYGVGLSIFKSYEDEINSYRDLKSDMVYIDSRDKKAGKIFKDTIKGDKMAVVMVSLNTKEKDLPKYLEKYKDPVFALLEEGDYGCHTHRQIPKVERLLKGKKTFRINASGTNIGRLAKAFGTSTITDVLAVPYSMVEEDTSIVDRVKRRYYNMSFDDSINKHLKDWDPDHLPSIGKIFRKPLAQKLWIEEVFKSIYDYEPQWGLSIDHQAGEQIFGSMIFGHFEKKPMEQLQKILIKSLPEHYIEILNGDTTNTRKAQDLIVKRVGEIKRGDHKGKRKLIVITNMIGSRSFTVPEIQACLMFQDNGEVGAWIQKTSRSLSPEKGSNFDQGVGKNFGHIFDFNMDPNKVRNTEMALIYDAKARSDLTGKTFVESLREVLNSASLKDVFKGKWLNDQDLLKRIEDTNKLLDVADNSTNFDIGDLSTLEINLLLSIKAQLGNRKKSKLNKLITGKTFKGINGKKNGASNDSSLLSAVRLAIKRINSSSTTVSDFVKGKGDSYSHCIDIIANDPKLDEQFLEMYGITANNLKQLLPRLPLGILDICIYNSKHGFSQKHITNNDLGILGEKDDPKVWKTIISKAVLDARIRYAIKNNGKIFVVAGGLGTEVDALVEKYGKKILKHIYFNDKFKCFTNRVKRKYNTINVIEGDFLSLNIDMKFDVILGNPPYKGQSMLHQKFFNKSVELLNLEGVIGFIQPATVYFNKKEETDEASQEMRNNINTYNTEVEMLRPEVFDNALNRNDIAITIMEKIENKDSKIKSVIYRSGKQFSQVHLKNVNRTELDPTIYESIVSKYQKMIESNGCIYDKITQKKAPAKAKLASMRGNRGGDDWYTFIPKDKSYWTTKNNDGDWGVDAKSHNEAMNIYNYFTTNPARFGLSINKFSSDLKGGAMNKVFIVDFSKSYTDKEIYDMLGLTEKERQAIDKALPNYHERN